MKILLFGAGSTGRGHLAALLFENGWRDLTFVDRDSVLVKALRERGSYRVKLLGGPKERILTIDGFSVLERTEEDKIVEAFLEAGLVYTAVIAENLDDVSKVLAKAIAARRTAEKRNPLNIVCCENLNEASSLLKKYTFARLTPDDRDWADRFVGFPDAMISRVVPLVKDGGIDLVAEDYNEWVVRKRDFLGADPQMPFMELSNDLEALLERKLWIHNGGHATVAYAGLRRGHRYIHEALGDPAVAGLAVAVMAEIGAAIVQKHGFPKAEVEKYAADFAPRGALAEMKDDLLRVVRDPIRKLGLRDRLLGPAIYCEEQGLPNGRLVESIANVLAYVRDSDAESVAMQGFIASRGLKAFLDEKIALAPWPELVRKIVDRKENE